MQFIYLAIQIQPHFFHLGHNLWVCFPHCSHIMSAMQTMDYTFRADWWTQTVKAEVVYFFVWVFTALITLRSQVTAHGFVTWVHCVLIASKALVNCWVVHLMGSHFSIWLQGHILIMRLIIYSHTEWVRLLTFPGIFIFKVINRVHA